MTPANRDERGKHAQEKPTGAGARERIGLRAKERDAEMHLSKAAQPGK